MVAYNWGCLLLHERSVDKYAAIGVHRMNGSRCSLCRSVCQKVGEFIEVDYADLRNGPSISMIF
jgi:hypothetical protein